MPRVSGVVSIALMLSLVMRSAVPSAQQGGQVQVRVAGAASGQQIEFQLDQAMNAGKISPISPTQSVLDFANMPKAQADVYQFTCPEPPTPPKIIIKIVPHGAPP